MDEWGKDLGASAAAGIVLSGGGGSCGSQDGTLTGNGSNEMKMADFAGAWAGNSDLICAVWEEDD